MTLREKASVDESNGSQAMEEVRLLERSWHPGWWSPLGGRWASLPCWDLLHCKNER